MDELMVFLFEAKESLSSSGLLPQGLAVHFAASMISGFNTAFVSMPVDIAKTRFVLSYLSFFTL